MYTFRKGTPNGWDGISTSTGQRGVRQGKEYRSLVKEFSFVPSFIDRSIENEKSAPMTRIHTQYSEVVSDVTKAWDSRHRARLIWVGPKEVFRNSRRFG